LLPPFSVGKLRRICYDNRRTSQFVKREAETPPKSSHVNIMAQYHVDYKTYDYPEISRAITVDEFLARIMHKPPEATARNIGARQR
jgi:uncharacterized Fe-S radical SAM superfamily protein PflX